MKLDETGELEYDSLCDINLPFQISLDYTKNQTNRFAEKLKFGHSSRNGFLDFLRSYLCSRELDTKNQYLNEARCYFSDEPLSRTFTNPKISNFDIIRYDINFERSALEKYFKPKKQTTQPVPLSEFSSSFKFGDGKTEFYEYLTTKLFIKPQINIQVGIIFSVKAIKYIPKYIPVYIYFLKIK